VIRGKASWCQIICDILSLFGVIYASLFFAVRFEVTFEKLAKTFQFLKVAIQDHISISF